MNLCDLSVTCEVTDHISGGPYRSEGLLGREVEKL